MLLSFVKGNHENYLLKGIPKKNHNEDPNKKSRSIFAETVANIYNKYFND